MTKKIGTLIVYKFYMGGLYSGSNIQNESKTLVG